MRLRDRLFGIVFVAAAAACEDPSGQALRVRIHVEDGVPATCVRLLVTTADEAVLASSDMVRPLARHELVVALYRGRFPAEVLLQAIALVGPDCPSGRWNGASAVERAWFVSGRIGEVNVTLPRPSPAEDKDGDGYVGDQLAGPDCDDNAAAVHPGAAEACTLPEDRNCDLLVGCEDASCKGQACLEPAISLAFVTAPQTVPANRCSGQVEVESRDRNGAAAPTLKGLHVAFSEPTGLGVAFFADSQCTQGIAARPFGGWATKATFFFRGSNPGSAEIVASVPGLVSAAQRETIGQALAPPAALEFTAGPATLDDGFCSPRFDIALQDLQGNSAAALADTEVSLTGASSTYIPWAFFVDPLCAQPADNGKITIPAGGRGGEFFFKTSGVGKITITAAAQGLASAGRTLEVVPPRPSGLLLTSAPADVLAGTCVPLTLKTIDAKGSPAAVPAAQAVALTSSAPANLVFYDGPRCDHSVSQIAVDGGSDTAIAFWRAVSAGAVEVTASVGGWDASWQTETIQPIVRQGSCVLDAGQSQAVCATFPGRRARTFLVFQATADPGTPDALAVRCLVTDGGTVECRRPGGPGVPRANVAWQTAELPYQVSVRHGGASCSGPTPLTPPINSARSFVLASHSESGNDLGTDDFGAVLLADDQVSVAMATCPAPAASYWVQVVSFDSGLEVDHFVGAMTGKTTGPLSFPGGALAGQAALLWSYSADFTEDASCPYGVRGELDSGAGVIFSRGLGGTPACARVDVTPAPINTLAAQRSRFTNGTRVQQVTVGLPVGIATTAVSISPVDPSRTLVFSGNQAVTGQSMGEGGNETGGKNVACLIARHVLEGVGSLRLEREATDCEARWTSYVVELDPPRPP